MRGKGQVCSNVSGYVGITPACAGKSGKSVTLEAIQKDHPRMCGEKRDWLLNGTGEMGSPPHVRGKGAHAQNQSEDGGITPACAGKRVYKALAFQDYKDHPRMCGEKRFCLLL